MEQPGLEPVAMWVGGNEGGGFNNYSTTPASLFLPLSLSLSFIYLEKYVIFLFLPFNHQFSLGIWKSAHGKTEWTWLWPQTQNATRC